MSGGGKRVPLQKAENNVKGGKAAAGSSKKEGKKEDRSVDMIAYLRRTGAFDKNTKGVDGLTKSQRERRIKRRQLLDGPGVPLCMIKRRGKPSDPCDQCASCSPCCDSRWTC